MAVRIFLKELVAFFEKTVEIGEAGDRHGLAHHRESRPQQTMAREGVERSAEMFDQHNLTSAVVLATHLAIGAGKGAFIESVFFAERRDHVGVETFGKQIQFDDVGDDVESGRRQHFGQDRHDALHQFIAFGDVGRPIEIGQEKSGGVAIFRAGEKIGVGAGKTVGLPVSQRRPGR